MCAREHRADADGDGRAAHLQEFDQGRCSARLPPEWMPRDSGAQRVDHFHPEQE